MRWRHGSGTSALPEADRGWLVTKLNLHTHAHNNKTVRHSGRHMHSKTTTFGFPVMLMATDRRRFMPPE